MAVAPVRKRAPLHTRQVAKLLSGLAEYLGEDDSFLCLTVFGDGGAEADLHIGGCAPGIHAAGNSPLQALELALSAVENRTSPVNSIALSLPSLALAA